MFPERLVELVSSSSQNRLVSAPNIISSLEGNTAALVKMSGCKPDLCSNKRS